MIQRVAEKQTTNQTNNFFPNSITKHAVQDNKLYIVIYKTWEREREREYFEEITDMAVERMKRRLMNMCRLWRVYVWLLIMSKG